MTMSMSLWQVIVLAAIQGLAELLPVSSSAHVVVAEKLMGVDPSTPEMTLLLVMLHTGTMFAVIVYFWNKWRGTYFQSLATFKRFATRVALATAMTGGIGEALIKVIERGAFRGQSHGEVEELFSHLELIAPALAAVGVLILIAGIVKRRAAAGNSVADEIGLGQASLIGAVQGLCLPFRGFSRSGATISTGMLAGVSRVSAENFSFALAVVLTPLAVAREAFRLIKATHINTGAGMATAIVPSAVGAVFAFLAGLVALKWLSSWLEHGLWYLFGVYCLLASAAVASLYYAGY
jgi:undecaprenyl-diphosphatase